MTRAPPHRRHRSRARPLSSGDAEDGLGVAGLDDRDEGLGREPERVPEGQLSEQLAKDAERCELVAPGLPSPP